MSNSQLFGLACRPREERRGLADPNCRLRAKKETTPILTIGFSSYPQVK